MHPIPAGVSLLRTMQLCFIAELLCVKLHLRV
jgi:hypothetical protein